MLDLGGVWCLEVFPSVVAAWFLGNYVASGRLDLRSICRSHLDLGHLPAIAVAWLLQLYLLS